MMIWQFLQLRHMLRPGFELTSPDDMEIPRCGNTADEAVAVIREHHAAWLKTQKAPD